MILHDEQAERDMIGCLVHSAGDAIDRHALTPEHFFLFQTRSSFSALLALRGGAMNAATLLHALDAETIKRMGGAEVVTNLCRFIPPGLADTLAQKLTHSLTMRRAAEATNWASGEMANPAMLQPDFIEQYQRRVMSLDVQADAENVTDACVAAVHGKLDKMDRGEKTLGFRTSIELWNRAFGGICEAQFYALAGRPGLGKTAMMEQLIGDYMAEQKPVLVFEKDMSPQKLIERMACRVAGIPFWKFMRCFANAEERQAIRNGASAIKASESLFLYNPAGLTAEKLCSIARREIRQHKIEAVFLDHVQALDVGRDLREGLTAASIALRRHITDTGVPMIVLAHLNREGGKGRPSANNIKEFDQLFGDVDGMAMLWSDEAGDLPDVRTVNFLISKNRDGPETEDEILFDGPRLTFKNKA